MITIFAIPKAFKGNIDIIQSNAIRSWTLLRPECEVILFGKDEGTAETALKLGIKHIPDIECNEFGTPLVSSVFSMAQNIASNRLLCYVNADIILLNDFITAIRQVKAQSYLMVGQRWDFNLNEFVNFADPNWETLLRNRVKAEGQLHPVTGIDYFVFPRGLYRDMPPFAIGRTAWDNWLIFRAREARARVIDGTKVATIIHQNHDYSHHPEGALAVWQGPEAKRNAELAGGLNHLFTTQYATDLLTPQGLKPALSPRYIYFRMRAFPVLYPNFLFLLIPFKAFELASKVVRKIVRTIVATFRIKKLAAT